MRHMVSKYRQTEATFLNSHLRLMENCLEWTKAKVYVDGTKDFPRAELFARSELCEMKMIHLIRDGRAYCNSFLKNRNHGIEAVQKAARSWIKHVHETQTFHDEFQTIPMLRVRYEDVCSDTHGTIQRICDFLELPFEDVIQDRSYGQVHMRGNRMVKNFDGTIKRDLSWTKQLGTNAVARINSLANSELTRFDYEL